MESYDREFWQFSDQLRLQTAAFSSLSIGDSIWSPSTAAANSGAGAVSDRLNADPIFSPDNSSGAGWKSPGLIGSGKLAFGSATANADRYNYFPVEKNIGAAPKNSYNNNNNGGVVINKTGPGGHFYHKNNGANNNNNSCIGGEVKNYFNKSVGRPANNNHHHYNGKKHGVDGGAKKKNTNGNNSSNNNNNSSSVDKRFKSLPASEALPRNEAIGGYIFVCNNDTMEENLKRELFGLPSRYRDSVRAIRPGLPLFLYNYSTHQLHGIFEAASFGGTNIDPTAWEDKKCPGESRFPAQVRVATRKICDPLEEDAFRPILHHYDGPKFRLELSVHEALSLLDIFAEKDDA